MKVLHLGFSKTGGAGVSAERLSNALNKIGIESEFIYLKPYSRNIARIGWLEKKLNGIRNILFSKVFRVGTINLFPSSLLRRINRSDADLIHLHWINAEMLSIEQIPKIKKPLAWTFHDMWPICGSESYVDDDCYAKGAAGFSGLSRWVWGRKKRALERLPRKVAVITPGTWMSKCARDSALFRDCDVTTLFNCLNLRVFRPMSSKSDLRSKYGLPENKKIILFGAYDVGIPRKGGDLLEGALKILGARGDIVLAIFGQSGDAQIAGVETIWLGRVNGDEAMAEVCNCADVVCVPSRVETFGQTASEPQACGVPVVAFDTTGLKDVIEHKVTGYLATPFDVTDFARGIEWVLGADRGELSRNARERAERLFDEQAIAKQCKKIYERVLARAVV